MLVSPDRRACELVNNNTVAEKATSLARALEVAFEAVNQPSKWTPPGEEADASPPRARPQSAVPGSFEVLFHCICLFAFQTSALAVSGSGRVGLREGQHHHQSFASCISEYPEAEHASAVVSRTNFFANLPCMVNER